MGVEKMEKDYDDILAEMQDEIITLKKENHNLKLELDRVRTAFRDFMEYRERILWEASACYVATTLRATATTQDH